MTASYPKIAFMVFSSDQSFPFQMPILRSSALIGMSFALMSRRAM
jgi:hypothetical protein